MAATTIAASIVAAVGSFAVHAAATAGEREAVLGPGLVTIDIGIHHSRFSVDRIRVQPGTTVRFVVANDDPIAHELVVGNDEVHERHAAGTERVHPPLPGEVSVAPGEIGVTAMAFDEPGTFRFACHLPGHLRYGMQGEVVVA